MTRIIGGVAGGRTLRTPTGEGTRPTSDRVREAVFSSLASRAAMDGGLVLDLFAGSGALGLEAVSRGSRGATLVESDRKAAAVISANVEALGLPAIHVVQARAAAVLARPTRAAYRLVFIDPPYAATEEHLAEVLSLLVTGGWLTEDALVVVERSTRTPEPTWPPGLVLDQSRNYGETAVWYATRSDPEPS